MYTYGYTAYSYQSAMLYIMHSRLCISFFVFSNVNLLFLATISYGVNCVLHYPTKHIGTIFNLSGNFVV